MLSFRLVKMMRLVGFTFTYVTLNCLRRVRCWCNLFWKGGWWGPINSDILSPLEAKQCGYPVQAFHEGNSLIEWWQVCTHYYDRDSWSLVIGFLCLTGESHMSWFYPVPILTPHLIQSLGFSSRSSHSPIYDKHLILWAQQTSYEVLNPRVSLHSTIPHMGHTVQVTAITISLLLKDLRRPHTQLLPLMTESHQDIPVMIGKEKTCRRLVILMKRMHQGRGISVIKFTSEPIAPDSRATCSSPVCNIRTYLLGFWLFQFDNRFLPSIWFWN